MDRATATAAEIADDELRAAAPALVAKVIRLRPTAVAFLGLTAYRVAFGWLRAAVGPQPEPMGSSRVWLLPNCSGLNALPVAGPRPPLRRTARRPRRAPVKPGQQIRNGSCGGPQEPLLVSRGPPSARAGRYRRGVTARAADGRLLPTPLMATTRSS